MATNTQKVGHILEFEHPIIELDAKIEELENFAETTEMDLTGQISQMRSRSEELKKEIFLNLSAWQRVMVARHPARPVFSDYLSMLFTDVVELHGDYVTGNDGAMFTGFGTIGEERCVIVGHRKGKTTKERIACNFGCANPEGYRKALAKMKLAAKFGLPIVTFIDTPGAFPGIEAERKGQAFAIARNLLEMARLNTPVICVVIGEGGSGGALGIGVGDRILMLEHSYYSVISPEGCATILWKSAEFASSAANILKLTAKDLKVFGIIDEILDEPAGGAHSNHMDTIKTVREAILRGFSDFKDLSREELLDHRYKRHRKIGVYLDEAERRIAQGANGNGVEDLLRDESSDNLDLGSQAE
ncbi:MAG: acetyl-CoA carboxylase carboxyltransferase subunit alpha [Planctomycetota bacterium]|nr:acetyl-CoA carboxylase carboxyltransferase subunit alpha [Planctomycetota bacterium]